MKKHYSSEEFKQFISEEIKKLEKKDLIESFIDKELSLLKESELTMDIFNNPEELKKFRQQIMSKAAGWSFSEPEMLSEKKVNPWAVCHASTGPKKTDKFERCVQDVKKKQGMDEEKEKPSAGLSAKQKSDVVKKAKAGKDIGHKGKGFKDVEAKAKAAGADDPKAVAAAAMWKNIKR